MNTRGKLMSWIGVLAMLGMCANGFIPVVHPFKTSRWTFQTKRKGMLYQSLAEEESNEDRERIIILGGGFGGLNAALTLDSLPWSSKEKKPLIKLIDNKERFVFLPLLYELCRGDAELEEVAPTFKDLLKNTDIEFVEGEITALDAANNRVYYCPKQRDAASTDYDALLVATGCNPLSTLQSVPGAEEYALTFQTIDNCYELKRRLALIDTIPDPQISVVGGGYSGVELALSLVNLANVTLIHRGETILAGASDFNREAALKRLKEVGVNLLLETQVTNVTAAASSTPLRPCTVELQHKTSPSAQPIHADILLWTAGAKPLKDTGVLNSILPRDTEGRIVTTPSLRVLNSTNVFAVGDVSRNKKQPYVATAQVAMQQAPVAAWNIYNMLEGKETSLKFRYLDLGQMMTLGLNDATITSLGGLFTLEGPQASKLRRLIYAVRMPTWMQKVRAGVKSRKSAKLVKKSNKLQSAGKK